VQYFSHQVSGYKLVATNELANRSADGHWPSSSHWLSKSDHSQKSRDALIKVTDAGPLKLSA